jgi:hypothetical protein
VLATIRELSDVPVPILAGAGLGRGHNLTGDLVDLEGTVDETCSQLTTVTEQADDIVTGVAGVSLNNALQIIGAVIAFPNLPSPLGTFECN